MGTFLQAQKRAKKLTKTKVKNDLFKFVRTLEGELAAYNRATLHEDSEDVFGKPIGFYSEATELISGGKKMKGDPFDLLETGDFLDGVFAKVERGNIFFDTKDSKKKKVMENLLTDNIFGLKDEDLKRVIDERISPFFIKYYREKLAI